MTSTVTFTNQELVRVQVTLAGLVQSIFREIQAAHQSQTLPSTLPLQNWQAATSGEVQRLRESNNLTPSGRFVACITFSYIFTDFLQTLSSGEWALFLDFLRNWAPALEKFIEAHGFPVDANLLVAAPTTSVLAEETYKKVTHVGNGMVRETGFLRSVSHNGEETINRYSYLRPA